MTHPFKIFSVLMALLLFTAAACTPSSNQANETAASVPPHRIDEKSDLIRFEYSYPDSAVDIAAVEGWMIRDIDTSRLDFTRKAEAHKKVALKDGYPFRPHEFIKEWSVTADTPNLFSLVAETYSYQGGANGFASFEHLLWSNIEQKFIHTPDLFQEPRYVLDTITPDYCARLNILRAEKRGAPVPKRSDSPFDTCPDVGQFNILPAADGTDGLITSFNIYLPENAAGPHAEGTYIVDIPITQDILDGLKPAYLHDFALSTL